MNDLDEDLCDNDLHIAVRLGDFEDVELALKKGFSPDTIGVFEWNPLHEASSKGDLSILKLLLKHGANPNVPDLCGQDTALHYACSHSHPDCVEALLKAGADGNILNAKKQSSCDVVRDGKCKEILQLHGYSFSKKPTKSILKPPNHAKKLKQHSNEIIQPIRSSTPLRTKPSKVLINNQSALNDNDDLPSPTSVDSGRFSATQKSPLKLNWETSSDGLLQLPSSPARSIGSSYGSMTSLGSSGCSVADDCAGHFVLSFQYNRKTEEFKIRLWEIRLISLLPPSKMAKDTSIHMYAKSNLIAEGEYQPNPALRKKCEVFRLYPGEQKPADTQCLSKSLWNEREARLEFKTSVSLEYTGISKQLVDNSSVKISLCIQRKRSILASKKSSVHSDPVLASVEVDMKEAVKRLMKESYDTDRHDVLGITRQAIPLDGVVADGGAYENRSFISDPTVHIQVSSLADSTDHIARSSSVGDLNTLSANRSLSTAQNGDHRPYVHVVNHSNMSSSVDLTSEEGRETVDRKTTNVSGLKSVVSHVSSNPEVRLRVPSNKTQLSSVAVGKENAHQKSDVKVAIPQSNNPVYQDFKRKQRDKSKEQGSHKARSKVKSGSRNLISSASAMVRPDATPVTSLDDEERSVGSPSEETFQSYEDFHRHRTQSSSSLVEVDESPSRARPRHPKTFLPSPQPSPQRGTPRHTPTKPHHFTLDIEPRNTSSHDIESGPLTGRSNAAKSPSKFKDKSETKGRRTKGANSLSTSRLQGKQTAERTTPSRDSVLRKLVFDETRTEDISPVENPCYVND